MPTLMLRPHWPGGKFRRTVQAGKRKPKRLEFLTGVAVEVTPAEAEALGSELGAVVFHVEKDDRGRFRFVEEESNDSHETEATAQTKLETDVAKV